MTDDLLAGYLRARRGQLRPADVGLPEGNARRRVTGLRREEVALLAGISADYYLRLEQGRGGSPSQDVLRSLARALRLDEAATGYLTRLGLPQMVEPASADAGEQVPATVMNLVKLLELPAFVTGQHFDVLAANEGARKISPELVPGKNRLRSFFLVESEMSLYVDWQTTAERFVAVVRDTVGQGATRPDFLALIDDLSEQSETFRDLWNRHDVVTRDTEPAVLRHPVAGPLRLHLEQLDLTGVPGQSLVVYHPEAGSPDADRLASLLSAPGPR
ncbi:helix-turn-helix transcriptional regulator [Kineosporia mesophila]|uniref:Helix-turn-helix transcriptional regulator n=1 Tax=Kineosporia mesophila TaxID=566012 RepID=A0ABP7AF70_9ACTN|nr:helix-turn-helix transcriptional regulator [Kineosporia mesophila]MCD5352883.1 helix-turn-helix transcriptional regulator [Kineosporia mesophila]